MNLMNEKNVNTDWDVEQIMDVLRRVPQKELPTDFTIDLSEKLKEEGRRITEAQSSRNIIVVRKKRFRIGFALAACLMVGFISIGTHNQFNTPDYEGASLSASGPEASDEANLKMAVNESENIDTRSQNMDSESGFLLKESPPEQTIEIYEEIIRLYLENAEFEIVSHRRNEETGQIRFEILVIRDKVGNTVNRTMILFGEEGEVHE